VIQDPGPETVAVVPKPLLRGRLHQAALLLAVPASILLVGRAEPGSVRLAVAIYALSLIALLGTSTAYHRLTWSPTALRRMRALDHSMIFLLIGGTNTAVSTLVLKGAWRWFLMSIVWAGALLGIIFKLVKIDGFRRLGGTLYIVLGWVGIAAVPQAIKETDPLPLVLIGVGGLMYTVGAVVFFRRRPDPKPLVFGYHEIWHAFVVAACACHYAGITMLLRATPA
jgi:hemolysin III